MDSLSSPRIDNVSGIILAGGKSSRFGFNKAFAEVDGTRLIEKVISVIESVFEHLIIITNTPEDFAYLRLPLFEDQVKGIGPLGGILTGLRSIPDDAGFVVGCDMPFLNGDLVRYMIDAQSDFDAVVPKFGWRVEALHALYHKRCLPAIEKMIGDKVYQTFRFLEVPRVRYIETKEMRTTDPELRSMVNINSEQELKDIGREGEQA